MTAELPEKSYALLGLGVMVFDLNDPVHSLVCPYTGRRHDCRGYSMFGFLMYLPISMFGDQKQSAYQNDNG